METRSCLGIEIGRGEYWVIASIVVVLGIAINEKQRHCCGSSIRESMSNSRRSASYSEAAQVGKWNLESAIECRTASPPVGLQGAASRRPGRLVELGEGPELVPWYPPIAPKVAPFLRAP